MYLGSPVFQCTWSHLIPQIKFHGSFMEMFWRNSNVSKWLSGWDASSRLCPILLQSQVLPNVRGMFWNHSHVTVILIHKLQILILVKICFQYLHMWSTQSHYHKMRVSKTWQHCSRSADHSFFNAVCLSVNSRQSITASNIEACNHSHAFVTSSHRKSFNVISFSFLRLFLMT